MAKKGDKHGVKNLKPFNTLTKEEQKKIASKGGKKSVESRKRIKDLKERLKLGLEIFTEIKAKTFEKLGNHEEAEILKELGIETYTLLDIVSNDKNAPQTKLLAINDILDRTEGKPIQKSILDANISEKELTDKEKELISRQIQKEANKLKNK